MLRGVADETARAELLSDLDEPGPGGRQADAGRRVGAEVGAYLAASAEAFARDDGSSGPRRWPRAPTTPSGC
jgi:hypothetical protein